MNPLKISVIGAEIAVVTSLAVSSYSIAFSGRSSDWGAAAPLVALTAIESMRLPLAFRLPRMRLTGLVCGGAMLAGLSVITGEAAVLGVHNLIFQRTRPVAEAERDLARAQISRDAQFGVARGRRKSPGSRPTSKRRARIGRVSTGRRSCRRRRRAGRAQAGTARGTAAPACRPRRSGRTPPPRGRTPTSSGTPARW